MHNPYEDKEESRLEKPDQSEKLITAERVRKFCIQTCSNSNKTKGKEAVCSTCSYNSLKR